MRTLCQRSQGLCRHRYSEVKNYADTREIILLWTHQPTGHFCRALWVTSTARLSTRRSLSLLPSKSKHPRRLLLPAALLMLLPCLELTIVAHQPLAKAYSMVVQYSPNPCSTLPTPAVLSPPLPRKVLCVYPVWPVLQGGNTQQQQQHWKLELSF